MLAFYICLAIFLAAWSVRVERRARALERAEARVKENARAAARKRYGANLSQAGG